jgi:transcriptional regulator with XRE-family HTH domain
MHPTTLRALRRRLGLTQVAMAEQIGVAPNTLARWERGELGMRPTTAKLIRILARSMEPKKGKTR